MCKQTGKFLRKMFILQNKNRIFFSFFIAGKMPAYLIFQRREENADGIGDHLHTRELLGVGRG